MLIDLLGPLGSEIHVADVGAAHFGETPPYQPLLDSGLARLTAFEPDEREAAGLQAKLGDRATLLPYALGDGDEHTLYVCQPGLGMTSLLEPDPATLGYFNLFEDWGRVVNTMPIATRRLDDISELDQIDYLKMDIQGSELSVLANGHLKLADSVAVQCEISFITLYKDQPTFGDIDLELRSQGLIPHRFTAVKTWSIKPTTRAGDPRSPFNQLLEADIVYIRDIIHPDDVSDAQLAKLALVAHFSYDSPDLTARCLEELAGRGSIDATSRVSYYEWMAAGSS
jgi:FkbM family methyltransferase